MALGGCPDSTPKATWWAPEMRSPDWACRSLRLAPSIRNSHKPTQRGRLVTLCAATSRIDVAAASLMLEPDRLYDFTRSPRSFVKVLWHPRSARYRDPVCVTCTPVACSPKIEAPPLACWAFLLTSERPASISPVLILARSFPWNS
jgi:hypothetical protein